MTPEALAALHARAMVIPAPWTARDFRDLLAHEATFLVPSSAQKYSRGSARGPSAPSPAATPEAAQILTAFALGRVVLDEAELLTLATNPAHRRQGLARACLSAFEAEATRRGAERAFLEVAASNTAARALYGSAGWQQTGLRKAYYKSPAGRIDAILMSKPLASA